MFVQTFIIFLFHRKCEKHNIFASNLFLYFNFIESIRLNDKYTLPVNFEYLNDIRDTSI